MLKLIMLSALAVLISCQGSSSGGGGGAKITSGNVTTNNEASAFIQNSLTSIPPSQRISEQDLSSWQGEGLISSEEAAELSENI